MSDNTSFSQLDHFKHCHARGLPQPRAYELGRLTRIVGMTLEATGLHLPIGHRCLVETIDGLHAEVEIVGFEAQKTFLMPLKPIDRIQAGAAVIPLRNESEISVGDFLLGRVIDGVGDPIDGLGAFDRAQEEHKISFQPKLINPLHRKPIDTPLDVGIRSINALLSVGCGQRIGLFAGSGVGKSVLLGMMTRFTAADVIIVALVGERGREVREFVESNLGKAGMQRTIVVASPADETPVMRLRAGMLATRLAEYYRDRGCNALLLFDSLTRYAQAQREIALATGEPPATKGYPPSVFSKLPQLVERAGNGDENGGSVTAFYTVLTEGDDLMDPVADSARAILDGHIVLSRDLAGEGVYPAVDIQQSISRAMTNIVSGEHSDLANKIKQLYARYERSRDLINVGAYTRGIDTTTDFAIDKYAEIITFLSQSISQAVNFAQSQQAMSQLLTEPVEQLNEQNANPVVVDNTQAATPRGQTIDAASA